MPREAFKADRKVYGTGIADAAEQVADLLQIAQDVAEAVFPVTYPITVEFQHQRYSLALAVHDRIAERIAPHMALLEPGDDAPAQGPTPSPAPPSSDDFEDLGPRMPEPPADYTR